MNAERYAVQLAKYIGAELIVVHATDDPYNAITDTLSETKRSKAAMQKSMQEEMALHCESMLKSLKVQKDELSYRCMTLKGKPSEVVCAKAEYEDADIIVVGTHGRSGFRNILYGTHAWQIIRKAKRPVLAVPKDGMFTGFERIVFATEQRRGEVVSLRTILRMMEGFAPAVTLLHISSRTLTKKQELEKTEAIRKEMAESTGYGKLGVRVLHSEKIIAGLNNYCNGENADLLILSPRGVSRMVRLSALTGSIAKKMSFYTRTPLLIVPDYYVRHGARIPQSFELNEIYVEE